MKFFPLCYRNLVQATSCICVLLLLSCSGEEFEREILPLENAFTTGLPIITIETPGLTPVASKTQWIEKAQFTFSRPDGSIELTTSASIKGRGNVTWERYPKKPYSLRFPKRHGLAGMNPSKRWVLLANWIDRTLIRNDVAFEISRRTSLEWTPQGMPVELILNGEYCGSYYLCEKIQVDKNRLNIKEMTSTDEDSETITGGYLMELDCYYDEVNKFHSEIYDLPCQFQKPDEEVLTPSQFNYMKGQIDSLEHALANPARLERREYEQWIDPLSFIDWWIVNELCYNTETAKPRSVYLHKQRGERIKAGPVWDFDYSTFTVHEDIYVAKRMPYLRRLFLNSNFRQMAVKRWIELRPKMASIPEYIDKQASAVRKSAEQNIRLWPISSKGNGDQKLTFDEAINRMKQAYLQRMAVIDNYLEL